MKPVEIELRVVITMQAPEKWLALGKAGLATLVEKAVRIHSTGHEISDVRIDMLSYHAK